MTILVLKIEFSSASLGMPVVRLLVDCILLPMGKGVDISKKKDKRQKERAIRLQISEDSRVRQACHNKWFKQQNPIVGELGLDRLELEDSSSMMRVTSMRMRQTCLSAAQLPTTEAQPPLVQLEAQLPLAQLVLAQRPTTEAQLLSVQFYIHPIL